MTLPQFRKALEETLLDPSVGIAGATDKLSKNINWYGFQYGRRIYKNESCSWRICSI
jgi:hypothetical protein